MGPATEYASAVVVAATRLSRGLSRLVPNSGVGEVVSCGKHCAHLRLSTDLLVTLLGPGLPLHPLAICLERMPSAFQRGDPVVLRRGKLQAGRATIILDGALEVDLRLGLGPRPPVPARIPIVTKALAELIEKKTGKSGNAVLLPTDGSGSVREVACTAIAFARGGDSPRLQDLLGLGPGLTPLGDDVLVGLMGGLTALENGRESRSLPSSVLDELRALIRKESSHRTSWLSSEMLLAAARGEFTEPLLEILWIVGSALVGGDTRGPGACDNGVNRPTRVSEPAEIRRLQNQLLRPVRCLAMVGHSSGSGMLWGLLAALRWAEWRLRTTALP